MLITLKEVASALHRLRLQPGQNVVVAGCGPVGIAMAALAKCMGAGKVVLAGHHPARIAAAKRLGADLAFDTREQPLADTVRGYMPEGVDLYIDAVGNPNLLMDGMRLIRQEGTIGLYGLVCGRTRRSTGRCCRTTASCKRCSGPLLRRRAPCTTRSAAM